MIANANAGFLGSEVENTPAAQARFHIIPVPFERTTSYGGGTGYISAASTKLTP